MKSLKQGINLWSFVLTIFCWALFFLMSFNDIGMNIHSTILILAIVIFIVSFIGLGSENNWKSLLRSIISLFGCASLIIIESYIIFIGTLMGG